jgi:hypothetical protein
VGHTIHEESECGIEKPIRGAVKRRDTAEHHGVRPSIEWRLAWKSTANGIHGRADQSAGKIGYRLATCEKSSEKLTAVVDLQCADHKPVAVYSRKATGFLTIFLGMQRKWFFDTAAPNKACGFPTSSGQW